MISRDWIHFSESRYSGGDSYFFLESKLKLNPEFFFWQNQYLHKDSNPVVKRMLKMNLIRIKFMNHWQNEYPYIYSVVLGTLFILHYYKMHLAYFILHIISKLFSFRWDNCDVLKQWVTQAELQIISPKSDYNCIKAVQMHFHLIGERLYNHFILENFVVFFLFSQRKRNYELKIGALPINCSLNSSFT